MNGISKLDLNPLNCLHFKQHVSQPYSQWKTHPRPGHSPWPAHWCVLCCWPGCVTTSLFNATSFSYQEAPVRIVRKCYITSEVVASFIEILHCSPAFILPAPSDLIVDHFNSKLKWSLDSVAPLLTKTA